MEAPALFIRDGDHFVGTDLTQGGWDPAIANGGVLLALLGHCLEDVPTLEPMLLGRFTADLVRPVPVGRRMRVDTTILREGKKIQLVGVDLVVDEVVHIRASALRLRRAGLAGLPTLPGSTTTERPADRLPPPEDAPSMASRTSDLPGFLRAVDMRQARLLDGSGHGAWLRYVAPVVAGEPPRPTARLVGAFDYANLIGVSDHGASVTMINPDVTAHVLREPEDGWIAITGDTRFDHGVGRGVSSATLSDRAGVFALVSTSQLVQPRG